MVFIIVHLKLITMKKLGTLLLLVAFSIAVLSPQSDHQRTEKASVDHQIVKAFNGVKAGTDLVFLADCDLPQVDYNPLLHFESASFVAEGYKPVTPVNIRGPTTDKGSHLRC